MVTRSVFNLHFSPSQDMCFPDQHIYKNSMSWFPPRSIITGMFHRPHQTSDWDLFWSWARSSRLIYTRTRISSEKELHFNFYIVMLNLIWPIRHRLSRYFSVVWLCCTKNITVPKRIFSYTVYLNTIRKKENKKQKKKQLKICEVKKKKEEEKEKLFQI